MKIFAPNATKSFGAQVAQHLGKPLGVLDERDFEDGEHKVRAADSVRGQDVYVLQSLYDEPEQSVNDKLIRLLFLIGSLKDGGARRVTAVMPYLAYARQDRQTKPRDPINTRYLAQLLEAAGTDAVVTLDVHNLAAFQNAFRCPAWHLDTRRLFAAHLGKTMGAEKLAIASPDVGGVKRAQLFRDTLLSVTGRDIGFAFMEKRRTGGVLSGSLVVGDVADSSVIIVDDMIASGGTMARAADAFLTQGAQRVLCLAAHGLFVGEAPKVVDQCRVDRWIVTDTIPPFRLSPELIAARLEIASAVPLFAEAIRCLHEDGSLSELLEGPV